MLLESCEDYMSSEAAVYRVSTRSNTANGTATLQSYRTQRKRSSEHSKRSSMAPDASSRFSQDFHRERNSATPDVIPAAEKNQLECESRLKCVLLGDGAVGKTSLVVSYTTNGYPTDYVPTAYDNYSVRIKVDGEPVRLQICDTAGQDEFDHLRPLCYPGTDVFLVCFSVVRPTSLCNVRDKWLPEIRKYYPKVPVVLVGTQTDLRTDLDVLVDLARFSERPIEEDEADRFARENGASVYVECSALTQKNLKEVFDTSILTAMNYTEHQEKKRRKKSWRRKMSVKRSSNSSKASTSKSTAGNPARTPSLMQGSVEKEDKDAAWFELMFETCLTRLDH